MRFHHRERPSRHARKPTSARRAIAANAPPRQTRRFAEPLPVRAVALRAGRRRYPRSWQRAASASHRASCSLQRSLRCITQPGTPARCKSEAWLLLQSLQMSAESVYPAPPSEFELSDEDVPLLFNDAPLSEVIHARADPSPPLALSHGFHTGSNTGRACALALLRPEWT